MPFTLNFPELAPNSVVICADENEDPSNVNTTYNKDDLFYVQFILEDNGCIL